MYVVSVCSISLDVKEYRKDRERCFSVACSDSSSVSCGDLPNVNMFSPCKAKIRCGLWLAAGETLDGATWLSLFFLGSFSVSV